MVLEVLSFPVTERVSLEGFTVVDSKVDDRVPDGNTFWYVTITDERSPFRVVMGVPTPERETGIFY